MKILFFLLIFCAMLFATEYELSYEDGAWSTTYALGSPAQQNLRVRFTPTSQVIGLHISIVKVYWHFVSGGSDLNFHFNIYDPDSGFNENSQTYAISNQSQWLTYDISSINYVASSNDFYLAAISDDEGHVGISANNHPPIDMRSAWQSTSYPDWMPINNYDLCLRAIFDDSVAVEPTSLGNIRALYR
jgi:hypothetical protein